MTDFQLGVFAVGVCVLLAIALIDIHYGRVREAILYQLLDSWHQRVLCAVDDLKKKEHHGQAPIA